MAILLEKIGIQVSPAFFLQFILGLTLAGLGFYTLWETIRLAADVPVGDTWKVFVDPALAEPFSLEILAKKFINHRHFWSRLEGWVSLRLNGMNFRQLIIFHQLLYLGFLGNFAYLLHRLLPNLRPAFWMIGLVPFLSPRFAGFLMQPQVVHYVYQIWFLVAAVSLLFVHPINGLRSILGNACVLGALLSNAAGMAIAVPVAIVGGISAFRQSRSLRTAFPHLVISFLVLGITFFLFLVHRFDDPTRFVPVGSIEFVTHFFRQLAYPLLGNSVSFGGALALGVGLLLPMGALGVRLVKQPTRRDFGCLALALGLIFPMLGLAFARGNLHLVGHRHGTYSILLCALCLGLWGLTIQRRQHLVLPWLLIGSFVVLYPVVGFEGETGFQHYLRLNRTTQACIDNSSRANPSGNFFCSGAKNIQVARRMGLSFTKRGENP